MSDLLRVLIDLGNCLKEYCGPAYMKLQAGLSYGYIREILTGVNVNDENLEEFYHWKNGITLEDVKYIGQFDFCSNGKMLPLEEGILHYNIYVKDHLWTKNFLPLFSNQSGDYLLYNTNRDSETYGMLFFYSPSLLIVNPETAYDSIESFCRTVIACYQQGIYKYNDSEGKLEIDQDGEFEISIENNSQAKYWRE